MTKESIADCVQLVFLDFIETIITFSIVLILVVRLIAGPTTSITIADDTLYDDSSSYIASTAISTTSLQLNNE